MSLTQKINDAIEKINQALSKHLENTPLKDGAMCQEVSVDCGFLSQHSYLDQITTFLDGGDIALENIEFKCEKIKKGSANNGIPFHLKSFTAIVKYIDEEVKIIECTHSITKP